MPNPYQLAWVEMIDSQEDYYKRGMRAKSVDEECEGTIEGIRSGDGDMDEGRVIYYPPAVTVRWSDGNGESFVEEDIPFSEVLVLANEVEVHKRAYYERMDKLASVIPVSDKDFVHPSAGDTDDLPF